MNFSLSTELTQMDSKLRRLSRPVQLRPINNDIQGILVN